MLCKDDDCDVKKEVTQIDKNWIVVHCPFCGASTKIYTG